MRPAVNYQIDRIRGIAGPGPYEARQSEQGALAQSLARPDPSTDPLNRMYSEGIAGLLGLPSIQQSMAADRLAREQFGFGSPEYLAQFIDSPLMPGPGVMAGTIRPDRVVHGTLAELIPSIRANYLTPGVGPNVLNSYGDEAADAALYLARDADPDRAIAAIRNQVGLRLNKPASKVTKADIEQYGALVVGRADEYDTLQLLDGGDFEDLAGNRRMLEDYPAALEPGDVFTTQDVAPTGFLRGRRLVEFIERNMLAKRAWPGDAEVGQ